MNSPLLNKVATAKRIVKEVLLIGGPGDGCRMPVNLNMKEVNVIDDDGEQHVTILRDATPAPPRPKRRFSPGPKLSTSAAESV